MLDDIFVFEGIAKKRILDVVFTLFYDTDRNPYWLFGDHCIRKFEFVKADEMERVKELGGIAKNEHTYQGEIEEFPSAKQDNISSPKQGETEL